MSADTPTPTTAAEDAAKLARDAGDYWSGSTASASIRDLSHWRGAGRFADEAAWAAIGKTHVKMVQGLQRLADAPPQIGTMLEWGQGGGSNAVAFAPSIQRFVAVDISQPNLEECGRQLQAAEFTNYTPLHIAAEKPESVLERGLPPLDLFFSTAVFQHFPGRDYGVRVLRIAAKLLAPRGLAFIQIRYDDGNPQFAAKDRDYKKHAVTFTSYGIPEFWNLCAENGLQPICLSLQPKANYAYFFLQKR